MKQATNKILATTILVLFIVWSGVYAYQHRGDFSDIKLANPGFAAILLCLFIIIYYSIGIVNNELQKAFSIRMSMSESFALSIVTGFYNMITPFRGGMAVRALYLKRKYNFTYVNFMASLSAVYVLTFLVASFLGIISTLCIYFEKGIFSWIVFVVFDAVFLLMLGMVCLSPKINNKDNKWLNKLVDVINGWHLIRNNKRLIIVTCLITAFQVFLGALMFLLQFRVFGIKVSFASAVFLSAISNLSILIGITPGNLGVQEAVTVFSAATIGISATQSLSAALLGRAVSLVVFFTLGPIFSYMLMRNGKTKLFGKGKKSEG
jgi:uncharacterized protein (TIRG00374 family)